MKLQSVDLAMDCTLALGVVLRFEFKEEFYFFGVPVVFEREDFALVGRDEEAIGSRHAGDDRGYVELEMRERQRRHVGRWRFRGTDDAGCGPWDALVDAVGFGRATSWERKDGEPSECQCPAGPQPARSLQVYHWLPL